MKDPKEKDSKRIAIGVAIILLALALILFGEGQKSDGTIRYTSEAQERVNRHLQETGRTILMKDKKATIETHKTLNEFRKSAPQKPVDFNPNHLEISEYQERHHFNEQVGRGKKDFQLPSDPNELIQTELFHDQTHEKMTEAYKKEYTRQFVENAKKAGWDVVVDSKYRIISVRKAQRKPTYEVFEGVGTGSR